jgi:hypothetical protein
VIVSAYLFYSFTSARPRVSNASFFLFGAGFMLVETKGITELGLVFGNTWQVIGILISGILVMAFLQICWCSGFACTGRSSPTCCC